MAGVVKFVSQSEINSKKEQKRKAREEIIRRAKEDFEKEERRREKREKSGESSWMLPSVSKRIASDDEDMSQKKKSKKDKKLKKAKKHKKKNKKKSKDEESAEESESGDEWVEKTSSASAPTADPNQSTQMQRDSWMLCPPVSVDDKPSFEEEFVGRSLTGESAEKEQEKEEKKLSCIDQPGQHPKELNPYWKDGGAGLPEEEHQSTSEKDAGPTKRIWDLNWLRKSYQRAQEQAEEEGKSLEEIVSQRWGSLERLESMIQEAEREQRAKREEETGRRNREMDRSYGRSGGRDREQERDRNSERDRERRRDTDRERGSRRRDEGRRDYYKDRDGAKDRKRDRDSYSGRDSEKFVEKDRHRSKGEGFKERQSLAEERLEKRREQDTSGKSARFLRPTESSSFVGTFKRPQFEKPSASTSNSSWDFSTPVAMGRGDHVTGHVPRSKGAGGWRKKPTEETSRDKTTDTTESRVLGREAAEERPVESAGSEDSSSSEDDKEEEEENTGSREDDVPLKKITEADLNQMGAEILRAELMGDEEQAGSLKSKLEQMRKHKSIQESRGAGQTSEPANAEEVVLTRTDRAGNTRPVEISTRPEPSGGRRKRKKVATHAQSGQRERYFADDDRYDLKELVRREKMSTAEDQEAMMARLSSRAAKATDADYFTLDDHFESSAATKFSAAQQEERQRQKAIAEHRKMAAQLSKCRFCFENPDISKHLIVAIGIKVYLAVPLHQSLTEGHCLIIPMQHSVSATYLDEDVWSEVTIFKKGLTKMFEEMEQDVVFLETCKQLRQQRHMIIECVPVPKEEGDMAPIYFKKAILESDTEWAQNKKLVDTRKKGLRASIPKGLPYFSVEFGLDGGFAHVIEDEELFPHYFGKEILGGMMDLEPRRWRKPRRENFEEHKKKVIQFGEWWKPYDWTQRLEKNK